jgi:beta-lactamase regulating signal transducer with metallopeptidase domain
VTQLFGIVCESLPLVTVVTLLALLMMPKRASATLRHQALVIAVLLSLGAPLLQQLLPAWRVLPRPAGFLPVKAMAAESLPHNTREEASPPATAPPPVTLAIAAPTSWRPWFQIAAAMWSVGVGMALLRLAFHRAALRRCLRHSVPAPTEIRKLVAELYQRPVQVRFAADAGDAFVCHVFSPVMVLPATTAQLPHDQLRLILAHEVAHLRRFDPLWAWLFEAFRAIYWIHPLSWVLVKRGHLTREMATDDLVLLGGSDPEQYAACLGSAALRQRRLAAPPSPALAFVRQHPVVARLHAILDHTKTRTAPSSKGWLSAGLPLAGPALLLASLGFKAAAEVQPLSRERQRTAANKVETIPSLWSDVVEPLVRVSAPPRESAEVVSSEEVATAPAPSSSSSSAAASASSGPDQTTRNRARGAPAVNSSRYEPDGTQVVIADDTQQFVAADPTPSHPRGFGFVTPVRTGDPAIRPTPPVQGTPSPPAVVAEPNAPAPSPAPAKPEVTSPPVTEPPSLTQTTETPLNPITTPSDPTSTEVVDDSPEGEASPAAEMLRISAMPRRGTHATPPDSLPGVPQLEIIPYATEAGRHFAVAWTTAEADAGLWIPQASPDLATWSSSPEDLILQGPFPAGDGTVRLIAALREPMPASHLKYLRLATVESSTTTAGDAAQE